MPGSDAELLAEFTASADPMSGRTVMRVLGVGWLRAKRLADLAGWTASTRPPLPDSGNRPSGTQPTNRSEAEDDETKPADHAKTRTTP